MIFRFWVVFWTSPGGHPGNPQVAQTHIFVRDFDDFQVAQNGSRGGSGGHAPCPGDARGTPGGCLGDARGMLGEKGGAPIIPKERLD